MQSPQENLQAGLAALKQQHYETAIAHLETVCQTATETALIEKAQAALVKAYIQTNQPNNAIARCRSLQGSPNPSVQSWAAQTFSELCRRYPALATSASSPDETGFVPLTQQPAPTRQVISPPTSPPPASASLAPTPLPTAPPTPPPAAPPTPPPISSPSEPLPTLAKTPPTPTAPKSIPLAAASVSHSWKNAPRSQKWNNLSPLDRSPLWALIAGTAIALIWLLKTLPMVLQGCFRWFSWQVALLTPFKALALLSSSPSDPWLSVAIVLLLLFALSPWLMDAILKRFYGLQEIKPANLNHYSPEAVRLLKRAAGHHPPTLRLLPTAVPLLFTYGYLPQNVRLVVTQGLLDQLEDAEIASLFAAELGHIANWDFGVLSWIALVAQLPYLVYWNVAAWGDRQSDRVLQSLAVLVSCLGYGLYWLCRLPGLWLARQRLYYSDRTAAELTGNPNALTRALLKLAIGIAQETERWGHSSYLLESFDLLTPVGYRTALSLGSSWGNSPLSNVPQSTPASILEWDRRQPYRHWLTLLDPQPPLGDRLHLLMLYAQHWRLEHELSWQPTAHAANSPMLRRKFRLQVAPFLGALIGFAAAFALWLLGWAADRFNWLELTWLTGDRSLLVGCTLIGFGIGMMTRINAFFPDIKRANLLSDPVLPDLLSPATALPIDSQPVRLQGKLLGRRGFANWLHQDLILQTSTGLVRLHHTTRWGLLGNLFPHPLRPTAFMPHPVTVTGWFRRGATPWVDIETLQGKTGLLQSQHPLWSTILAFSAALLGVLIILLGGA
ncbi:M48 family metalloprotease [Phormidium tenue FACHB-886]|nr:M48 family metalloprotease [Phormidium tenue FACHB-886]